MNYIPNTEENVNEMLAACGVSHVLELFKSIPQKFHISNLKLPEGLAENDLLNELEKISLTNQTVKQLDSYLGGGAYEHYIPPVVKHIFSRGEFYTAYTPYQPEASQGTLQTIYEYQSLICELFNMDVCNASLYDGATAFAEAVLVAYNVGVSKGKDKVIISKSVSPEYKRVLKTYLEGLAVNLVEIPLSDGEIDIDGLKDEVDDKTLCVAIQNPNFFGLLEPVLEIERIVHSNNALFIVDVKPISLGLVTPPGNYNADIAVAEGQVLGNSLSYGGPYLGVFTCKKELMRKMPGRVVGKTKDKNGNEGFVLTLQAREQHIRREKATSNICSNQALNALAAAVYLSCLGKQGIRELAYLNLQKSHYAYEKITELDDFGPLFTSELFFNEFPIITKIPVDQVLVHLRKHQILGGIKLEDDYPKYKNGILICVTETKTKAQIDRLVDVLGQL